MSSLQGSSTSYDELKEFVEHKYNRNNGYATVSLDKIFQELLRFRIHV